MFLLSLEFGIKFVKYFIDMYEMLGNQYFLARNYSRAAENLEKALRKNPRNKRVRRKLIICYTQLGEVEKALNTFISLIKEDVDFVINTDPIDDDCPCSELVFDLERKVAERGESLNDLIVLGILWLYCNVDRSWNYFLQASRMNPDEARIKSVLSILKPRIDHPKLNQQKGGCAI